MLGKAYLGARVSNLDTGESARISRVNLLVDSDHMYTAGDDSGRTLEKTCPWGTQAMADSILASLRNVDYRPYSGQDGLLDPAAEVGDGITVGGLYSVLAYTDILFDGLGTVDISAPGGDEAEDEYPYKSRARRQSDREQARIYSVISKTSERITLLVANEVEGLSGRIDLTATALTTQINMVNEGLNSRITQTATSLTTEIENTRDSLNSKIEQTESRISLTVSAQGRRLSSLEQTVDGFTLTVENGTDSSTIRLMSGRMEFASEAIYFRGMVTFEDLSQSGRTVINGGNITTGTIEADTVSVNNSFQVWYRNKVCGYMGGGEGYDGTSTTVGAMLTDWTQRNYLLATEGGVRMQDSQGGAIWVTDGYCFSSEDMQTYSDRRLKTDIDYDLECYKAFFRALKPCRFLMRNNPGKGYHTGFVAQDVQAAMEAARLSPMDFAGLADAGKADGEKVLSLSYGSFAALNTMMIQDLERRVSELERRLQ